MSLILEAIKRAETTSALIVTVSPCPYCRKPIPGPLAGCDRADCQHRDITDATRYERSCDR